MKKLLLLTIPVRRLKKIVLYILECDYVEWQKFILTVYYYIIQGQWYFSKDVNMYKWVLFSFYYTWKTKNSSIVKSISFTKKKGFLFVCDFCCWKFSLIRRRLDLYSATMAFEQFYFFIGVPHLLRRPRGGTVVSWLIDWLDSFTPYQQYFSHVERLPRRQKVICSNPSPHKPKSLKQVVTDPLLNARRHVWLSWALRDD